MAVRTHAPGDGPATGMSKTPAPDQISNVRAPSQAGYGMSGGPNNPSSIEPSRAVESVLGSNMRQSSDDGEGLLDRVQRLGVAKSGDAVDMMASQTRHVDDTPYPPAFGMKSPDNSVRVPAGDATPRHMNGGPGLSADDLLKPRGMSQPKLPTAVSSRKDNSASNAATNAAMAEGSKAAGKLTAGQLVGSGAKLN